MAKRLFAATRNGVLIAIDTETRKIIWKYKAGNSSINKVVTDSNHDLLVYTYQRQNYWYKIII